MVVNIELVSSLRRISIGEYYINFKNFEALLSNGLGHSKSKVLLLIQYEVLNNFGAFSKFLNFQFYLYRRIR